MPSRVEETDVLSKHRLIKYVLGADEAGHGAIAGPVVAACVHINEDVDGIQDSKKFSSSKAVSRETIAATIIKSEKVIWYHPWV